MREAARQSYEQIAGFVENLGEATLIGMSIVNEGADWVITAGEIADGNHWAAIGFLPFLSWKMIDGGEAIIRNAAGVTLRRFDKPAVEAIAAAARKTIPEQYDLLKDVLTVSERIELYSAGWLGPREEITPKNAANYGGEPNRCAKSY